MKTVVKLILIISGVAIATWAIMALIATPEVLDTVDDAKISAAKTTAKAVVTEINLSCAVAEQKGEDLCSSSEMVISNIENIVDVPYGTRILDLEYDTHTNSVKSMIFEDGKITIIYDGKNYNVE